MMKHDKDIVIVVVDMSTPIFDKVREISHIDFQHGYEDKKCNISSNRV